jgi:hypothetical protein
VGKTLGMRASRLATTVELALASLSWSGAQERAEPWLRAMASEGGSDPSEDEANLFAVTESLVGAGIAPSIHLGRGIIINELSRTTVSATIESDEDEGGCVFEFAKEELWRAVKLLDELDGGPETPSAAVSRDSRAHRRKMADMFLTTEMPPMGYRWEGPRRRRMLLCWHARVSVRYPQPRAAQPGCTNCARSRCRAELPTMPTT